MSSRRVGGSYRDPRGRVFLLNGRVLRAVSAAAAAEQGRLLESGLLADLAGKGRVVSTWVAGDDPATLGIPDAALLLEHQPVPFVSYPYEWPFSALQAAALLHLDLHLELLERGFTLRDASAYNVQFRGPQPVFIDTLSIERYAEGSYWSGHRQFCEQFLAPLLLTARLGVPFHAAYRGRLDGISAADLAAQLRWWQRLSPQVLLNVVLPVVLEKAARRKGATVGRLAARPLPLPALLGMLRRLRRLVERLRPPRDRTAWTHYADTNAYDQAERGAKRDFVAQAVRLAPPGLTLDLGCNTGDYAAVALEAGARAVVGAEADANTADRAFIRAREDGLALLPLVLDVVNPSPAQGWLDAERSSFRQRAGFDFLIALAIEHHLAIGRNVPLDETVRFLVGLAPRGIIEFVQKSDPMIQRMLALREDVFPDYCEESFRGLLAANARIVESRQVSRSGRLVFLYDRS